MFGSSGVGWLYSLANDPPTNWGTVDGFFQSVEQSKIGDSEICIESEVWGILRSMDVLPAVGDGLAFYHSTRAGYPDVDRYQRKPRISLIGELLEIERDGRNITRLSVSVDPLVLNAMRMNPIVRNDRTRQIFEACRIVKGPPATMYHANEENWRRFVSMVRVPAT